MKTVAFIRATNIYDDSRATKEILALLEAGYRVQVLGWDRNGTAAESCRKIFEKYSDAVSFSFYPVTLKGGIGLKNIHKLLGWFRWVNREISRSRMAVSAIHACNLDGGMGAYRFSRREKIPFIYDIYDYYVDSHSIPGVARGTVEALETHLVNRADLTIICTEERKEQIAKATPRQILVMHNSPDLPQMPEVQITSDYAYCGSLCERRLILEILGEYANHDHLRFDFAGNDRYQPEVEAVAEKFENFQFHGTVNYEKVLEIEAHTKVLSAIYEPTIRNHRLCAPNKFYEALALGKPLIVCRGTGIDQIVKDHDLGIVIDYNAEQFYKALEELITDSSRCKEMGQRARSLYENHYRWELMKNALIDQYRKILK